MTSIQGTCATPSPTQFEQDDIDMDGVHPELKEHVDAVEDSYLERIADLERQIETTDDPQYELELQDEIMRLEEAFDDFVSEVERLSEDDQIEFGPLTFGHTDANVDELQEIISEFRAEISDSYAEFGTNEVPPDIEAQISAFEPFDLDQLDLNIPDGIEDIELDVQFDAAPGADTESTAGGVESSETGGTEQADAPAVGGGAEQAGGADEADAPAAPAAGGGGGEVDGRSPEAMVNLMSNDPDAFYAEMQQMDPEDRHMMMTMVQQQLQEMNQMFQMISQFQQAIHDTQKAVIQNMRV